MQRRQFLSTAASFVSTSFLGGLSLAEAGTESSAVSKDQFRVGVIGHTGRGNYGHGVDTLWLKLPQTRIVGVADADPSGLAAAQKRLGNPKGFGDYREMLSELKPDVVAVCPRHVDQHFAMISAAIEAGAKGIYVEKPFVRTPAEADEIVRLCQTKNVKLAIAHRNRYHPALEVIRESIAAGEFGTPLEIHARGKEDQRGGGLDLWVLGTHVLNLGTVFAGKPLACSAGIYQAGRLAVDTDIHEGDEGVGLIVGDEIHARFEMEHGIPLFFDSKKNAVDRSSNFGLQILCSGGTVDLRIDTEPLVHVLKGSPYKPVSEARAWIPVSSAGIGKPEPLANIRDLVAGHLGPALDLMDAIKGNRWTLCGPEEGLLTIEMVQSIFASHRQGGARVTLPLANRGNALS